MKTLLSSIALLSFIACAHGSHGGHEVNAGRDTFTGNNCGIQIKPLDFTDVMVSKKTEADYVASLSPDDQAKYADDKHGASDSFVEATVKQAAPFAVAAPAPTATPWVGFAHVTFWEPGTFAGPFSKNAHMDVTYQIQDPSGKVVEQFHDRINPNLGVLTTGSGSRMKLGGRLAGEIFGRFMQKRFECSK